MHLRWNLVVIVCLVGVLALGVSIAAPPSRSSLAMQGGSPTPPSGPARAFCPVDQEIPFTNEDFFEPTVVTGGSISIQDFAPPNPGGAGAATTGQLLLTVVNLPDGTCMLGSYFYPGAVITMRTGQIDIFIEHWPGNGDPPDVFVLHPTETMSQPLALDVATTLVPGDWVRIEREAFVGFKNDSGGPAEFVVAGLKPDGDPGGGGGGSRGRP